MAKFLIAEQECFGKIHFRVMRTDGDKRFGGYHSIDMDDLDSARSMVEAEVSRNKLGSSEVLIKRINKSFELVTTN